MKTKQKKLTLKLPKHLSFVWFKGFLNGKTGTAALNDHQIVESGYIQTLQKKYDAYVAAEIEVLDFKLHKLCVEAEKLLITLKQPIEIFPQKNPTPITESAVEKRSVERFATMILSKKMEYQYTHRKTFERLIEIRITFSELEVSCQEKIQKVASETEAVFAAYCKGVIRGPLKKQNIPTINTSIAITQFHEKIKLIDSCLKRIDKEIEKYD